MLKPEVVHAFKETFPERVNLKKKGGGVLLCNSQRSIYHLLFVLIFGVLSEGKKITQSGPRLKTYQLQLIFYFIKELIITFYILPESVKGLVECEIK